MDIANVQNQAWVNKERKGFNTTDIALEFGLLTAEVSEAFTAWRFGMAARQIGSELADIVIYAAGLAEMVGIDLDYEVTRKLALNADRAYVRSENGTLIKKENEA